MIILERSHQSLHRPQRSKRENQDQRQPQDGVDPIRRMINCLRDQGGADNDEAGRKHDEGRGPVAGIGKAVVEPADVAAREQRQEARKQLSPATMRTAAAQSRFDGGDRLAGHVEHLKQIPFGG